MSVVGDLEAILTLNTSEFTAKLTDASAKAKAAGDAMGSSQGGFNNALSKTGETIGTLGEIMTGVGAGIIGTTTMMAVNFQKMTDEVGANAGMSSTEIDQMSTSILNLGTQGNQTYQNLGDAYMHAYAELGSVAKATIVVSEANKVASATGANVSDVTDALSTIMHIYGLNMSQAGEAMNIMTSAVQQGNMKMSDFSPQLKMVSNTARNMNIPLSDVAASISVMTKNGISATLSGRELNSFMLALTIHSKAATKEIATVSKESGINLTYAMSQAGIKTLGYSNVLAMLQKATGGNVQEMKTMLGSIQATKVGLALTQNQGKDYIKTLDGIHKSVSANAVDKSYQEWLKSAAGQMSILKGEINKASIEIGTVFIPILLQIIKDITPIITVITNWISTHKILTATILENVLTMGLMLIAISKGIQLFLGIQKAIKTVITVVNTLKDAQLIQKAAQIGSNIVTGIQTAFTYALTAAQWLLNAAMLAFPVIFLVAAIVAIIAIIVLLVTHWSLVTQVFNEVVNVAKTKLQELWNWFSTIIGDIVNFVKSHMDLLPAIFLGPIGLVITLLTTHFSQIENLFSNMISGAEKWGSDMIHNFINGITSQIGNLKNSVGNAGNAIKGILGFSKPTEGPLSESDKWMPDMINLLIKGINGGVPKLKNAINTGLTGVGTIGSGIGGMSTYNSPTQSNNSLNNNVVNQQQYYMNVSTGATNETQTANALLQAFQNMSYNALYKG